MTPLRRSSQLLVLLLSAALALPWAGPAYALREPQPEAKSQRAGLGSALQPATGLEETYESGFLEMAQARGLRFDATTPIYLLVGAHLGGRTAQQCQKVAQVLGRPERPVFFPLEIPPAGFAQTFRGLLRHPQLRGFIITTPYKTKVAELAGSLGITLDETARRVGVASYLTRQPDGTWIAGVPDGKGFVEIYRRVLPSRTFAGARVVLFGAGGAGRAILEALLDGPAGRPASLVVIEPDPTARAAAEALMAHRVPLGVTTRAAAGEQDVTEAIRNADVLINATELGKLDDRTPLSDPSLIRAFTNVFDLNWWPNSQTRFLKDARRHDAFAFNGMRLSAWLNARQFAGWFGLDPDGAGARQVYWTMYLDALRAGFQEAMPVEETPEGWETIETIAGWVYGLTAPADPRQRRTSLTQMAERLEADWPRRHVMGGVIEVCWLLNGTTAGQAWLQALADNLVYDVRTPGDAWEAFQLRQETQALILRSAQSSDDYRVLLAASPVILDHLRRNLTADYTYRGPVLVEGFRALTRKTLEALEIPAEPAPRSATAGLEESTTVDQLLARFPRLLAAGPRAYAKNRPQDEKPLRVYHQQFFSRPDVQAAKVDPAFVASRLRELEDAEADVARLLPGFPKPPVAFIDLDYREGGNWAEIRDSGLRINVAHGRAWQAVAPFLFRHELGERILDEEPEYRLAVVAAASDEAALPIRRDHVLTGWPGHPFLIIPAWPRATPRPSPIPLLLAPPYGARVWDVVADRVALLLTDSRPEARAKVASGMRAFLQQHRVGIARQAYELEIGARLALHPHTVVGGLGTLAVAEVAAEMVGANEDAAALHEAALHLARVLDNDPDPEHQEITWSAAYAAVTDYYRTIARELQLRPTTGLEEITTVDQLLARFPRLRVGEGTQDSYQRLFENRTLVQLGMTVGTIAHVLTELEAAEADLQRALPQFPVPAYERVELVFQEPVPFGGYFWMTTDLRLGQWRLTINLHPGEWTVSEWQRLVPYLLRHELGEAVWRNAPSWWRSFAAGRATRVDQDFWRRAILEGFPDHPYVVLPPWAEPPLSPRAEALLTPLGGWKVWDVVADTIALQLAQDSPSQARVVEGIRAYHARHYASLEQSLSGALPDGDGFRRILISQLTRLMGSQAIDEILGSEEDHRRAEQAARLIPQMLPHLQDVTSEDWRPAVESVLARYRRIARDLQLRTPGTGMEEHGWAREMVGELFSILSGQDMSERVQIIAPSVVKRDRYRFLAGFVGRSPFVMVPPVLSAELTTGGAMGDALVRETPAWGRAGVFYGETAEYRAFLAALARAGRSVKIDHHPLDDRPDALALLRQLLTALGLPDNAFEGRLRTLQRALETLAAQY